MFCGVNLPDLTLCSFPLSREERKESQLSFITLRVIKVKFKLYSGKVMFTILEQLESL